MYDLAVIGAGPGGYVAAIRAAQLGLKTVCIEKEKTLGGTCLNVGCIPSKALLQSSEHYSFLLNSAKEHGIEAKCKLHFDKMMKRKEKVVESLTKGIEGLFKKNKVEWKQGKAKLQSNSEIEISSGKKKEVIQAKNILIATGSETIPLPFLEIDEKIVVSSTGALSLSKIPKKLIVVGAGVIGVELASVYNRLGTEVTVIELLDRICAGVDLEIGKALQRILSKQGLIFHLGTKVIAGKSANNGVTLTYEKDGKESKLKADVVLLAIGRKPYSEDLGLKEVGIKCDNKGFIEINDHFQTSVSNIYAIGDIVEGPMLAHKASEEGIVAVEIIAGKSPHINYMGIPNVIYTHPEVASVGLTEEEANAQGLQLLIGKAYFQGNPRARCAQDTDGFVKVIGEKNSRRLIGLHIVGPNASEMIGEGAIAIETRATLDDIINTSHAHPTLCESILEAALDSLGRAIHQ